MARSIGPTLIRPMKPSSFPTEQKMILQALTELREPNGSGRRAIAKYILDNFSRLPARHDALRFVHLRRLRSQGLLLMGHGCRGKNAVPVASSAAVLGVKRGPGRPRKNDASPFAPPPASGGKRGVGRPRKNATPVAPLGSSLAKRSPGRPRENVDVPIASPPPSGLKRPCKNATPVVPPAAVLGAKRGRGRPPKNASILSTAPDAKRTAGSPHKVAISVAFMPSGKARPGRPPPPRVPQQVLWKAPQRKLGQTCKGRRPGRPRKDKPLQSGSVLPGNAAFTKRGPGRPRKDRPLEAGASVAAKVEAGTIEDGVGASSVEKKGPGRPRKEVPLKTEHRETGIAALVEKRGRGRPKKEKPSEARPAETGDANKRGRGTPRPISFKSWKTTEIAGVVLGETKETRPADAAGVLVSGENTSTAPVEAGSGTSDVNTG
ncbi:hypothetical protein GUJ93_ZPchr0005g14332 [Zizania palustris]|uniref:H15 domain-containing protein n=1 Tax=Zizania palustris TaxID=103762 RepID=A0A8J5S4S5_ZIZPA|nr:hypothetical protein GUJ93_ZPchr0005g14332 [Zizania palustris]